MKVWMKVKQMVSPLFRREGGSSTIELAIVLPILLLLFAGTTELGRLFYTYTTLAKATRGGARYLSLMTDVTANPCGSLQMSCTTAGKNMVMCGNAGGCGGAGQPALILSDLTAAKIVVTPPDPNAP